MPIIIITACKPEKKKKAECDASNNNLIFWLYGVTCVFSYMYSIKRCSSWDQSNLKHKKHLLFPLSAMSTSSPISGGCNNSGLVCFNYTWEIHPHSTCFIGGCCNSSWYVRYSIVYHTVCHNYNSYIYQTFFLLELKLIVHYQLYCRIYLKVITWKACYHLYHLLILSPTIHIQLYKILHSVVHSWFLKQTIKTSPLAIDQFNNSHCKS